MADTNAEGAAPSAPSLSDENEKQRRARLEVENGFRQYDIALDIIRSFLHPDRPFALRPTLIQDLQAIAVEGLEPYPGQWRQKPVGISKSRHTPPGPHLVPALVVEMCDYVNDTWHEQTAFHLAAYVMWRLNWIHPFSDGNGRTSRMTSYIVLCTKLNSVLPGAPSIPQQIQADRTGYIRALETADDACVAGGLDVSQMEDLLRHMLAKQLLSVIERAGGVEAGGGG